MESISKFQNPRIFFSRGIQNLAIGSGIQHQESGILLTIEIRNPSSTDCKKESGIHGSKTVCLGLLWLILQKISQRSCWLTRTKRVSLHWASVFLPLMGVTKKNQIYFPINRQEKSLRHIAMAAKVLDDNKPKKSLTARSPKE